VKWFLEAYDHYFDAVRHAEIQDRVHARLDEALRSALAAPRSARSAPPAAAPGPAVDEPEWTYLRRFREGSDG